MDHLLTLARNNSLLEYIDDETGKSYTLKSLPHISLPSFDEKKLVFLYLDNSILSISVFWSFWDENYALVLLDSSINQSLKINLEEKYYPLFVFDQCRDCIENFIKHNFGSILLFKNNVELAYPIAKEVKLLLSTSGTTGSPKLVKLSEMNIVENAKSIIDYLPITNTDVTPLNLPLFYSYGFSVFTTNAIAGGKTICTNKTIFDKEFWTDFEKYGYTSIAGVPYVYEMLNRIGFTKIKRKSLRYMTQAGGKLNERAIDLFSNYCLSNNAEFFTMYGQTEATARISYLHPKYLPDKIGSIGRPIKNGKFIIKEDTGELCYSGPNISGGYAKSKEDLNSFVQLDELRTGDVAIKDEDGFYFIKGRIKRFIKLFGKRINLDDIENICKISFPSQAFGAIGIDDKEIRIVYEGPKLENNVIRKLLHDKLSIHSSYIKEEKRHNLPLTGNGKINYKEL